MRLIWLTAIVGCASSTPTGHISAELQANLDETTLSVTLRMLDYFATNDPNTPPPTYMLTPDEHLRVTFLGQHFELQQNPYSSDDRYGGSMPVDGTVAMGEPLELTFARDGERSVTLTAIAPAEFVLEASPTDPVVTWSPTSPDLMLWSSGFANGAIQNDIGRVEFPPGVLVSPGADVAFSRSHGDAPLLTGFLFAVAQFERTHTVTVKVTP